MKQNIRLKPCSVCLALLLMAGCFLDFSCKKLDFTKIENPPGKWLFYDDGSNYTGISAGDIQEFDIAIRFYAGQLSAYDGFLISQVRFFPLVGENTMYAITYWKGPGPTYLDAQYVPDITVGQWNTVDVEQVFYVDDSQDLWIGVWIQDYPWGTYPAGCDDGPAYAGMGDLYSLDAGVTWYSIYNTDGFNYNWNLQVLVTDMTGGKSAWIRPEANMPIDDPMERRAGSVPSPSMRMKTMQKQPTDEN